MTLMVIYFPVEWFIFWFTASSSAAKSQGKQGLALDKFTE